ncbi:MAG: hypothetical protein ACK44T_02035 [Sphingomonadales bacterium]
MTDGFRAEDGEEWRRNQGSRKLPPSGRTAARFILGLARMCFCCGNAEVTVFRRINFAPFSAALES